MLTAAAESAVARIMPRSSNGEQAVLPMARTGPDGHGAAELARLLVAAG
jgi:hypothetical protein